MELSKIIRDIKKQGIIILFTSLPNSKGRHDEFNGQKYIFVDNELSEVELINVLLHEKAHCLKDDINNTLSFVETYNHRIENETEKNRIIDFLNLINQEYPIDESFNYIEYMKKAFIPDKYENFVKETVKKLYLQNITERKMTQ